MAMALPDAHPWRRARTWLRPIQAALFNYEYLGPSLCATEQCYLCTRGGQGWDWQTDTSFEAMRAAMLQQLGGDGFAWTKPGLGRVFVNWLVVLCVPIFIFLAVSLDLSAQEDAGKVILWIICLWAAIWLSIGRYAASIGVLRLLRRATSRHMAACAWLHEFAARVEHPVPARDAQQVLQMHAMVAYLQELQRLQWRAAVLRAWLWPFAVAFPMPPPQALLSAAGKDASDVQACAPSNACGLQQGSDAALQSGTGQSLMPSGTPQRYNSSGVAGLIDAAKYFVPNFRRLWHVSQICEEAAAQAAEWYGFDGTQAAAAAAGAMRQIRHARPPNFRSRAGLWTGLVVPLVLCYLIFKPEVQKHGINVGLVPVCGLLLVKWGTFFAVMVVQRRILGRMTEATERLAAGDANDPVTAATDCVLAACGAHRGQFVPLSMLEGPHLLIKLGDAQA